MGNGYVLPEVLGIIIFGGAMFIFWLTGFAVRAIAYHCYELPTWIDEDRHEGLAMTWVIAGSWLAFMVDLIVWFWRISRQSNDANEREPIP